MKLDFDFIIWLVSLYLVLFAFKSTIYTGSLFANAFFRYDHVEWLEYIADDGSLLYIESYVSSTVREKQVMAMRTSRDKKLSAPSEQATALPKMEKLQKESKLVMLWYSCYE